MFKDQSIFQGICEFESPDGMMQAHDLGSNHWGIYLQEEDGTWVRNASVKTRGGRSCRAIYAAYERTQNC